MKTILNPFQRIFSSKASLIWLVVLLVIPLLSVFGRPLQYFIQNRISSPQLAVLFFVCSFVLLIALARFGTGDSGKQMMFHMAWGTLLFLGIPLLLDTVVERVHFIIFGIFGFLSVTSYGLRSAVVICSLVSCLDELLQWFLPDRVGDWRDVGFNWLACLGGCLLARFLHSRAESTP